MLEVYKLTIQRDCTSCAIKNYCEFLINNEGWEKRFAVIEETTRQNCSWDEGKEDEAFIYLPIEKLKTGRF